MRVQITVIAKSDYRVASAPRLDRLDLVPSGGGVREIDEVVRCT